MKKNLAVLIVITMLTLTLSGCSGISGSSGSDDTRPKVICTLFPMYDIVTQISGDKIAVSTLAASGTDGHSYEPSPADIIAINNCDLFIYIGGESEVWVDNVLSSIGSNAPDTLKLIGCAGDSLIEEDHDDHGHAHDADDLYDEHIWTSPKIYQAMISSVCTELCRILPEETEYFISQAQVYSQKITELDSQLEKISADAKNHTLVFGDKFPFKYLAQDYGFDYIAAFDGCGEDTEPSAGVIASIINYVRANDISVIFCMSDSSPKIAQTIAAETGAEILTLHSCHTLTSAELKNKENYISLMSGNIEKIGQAAGNISAENDAGAN